MAEGVLFNIAEKVLEFAGKQAVKEVASYWGARGDLDKLGKTLELIKARVRDAESRHEDGGALIKAWLGRLRQVLYQADDLFDDVLTVDRQRQRMEGSKVINQVRLVFSMSGPLRFNMKMAHEIKRIRQELDAIKSDMSGLNLREVHEPRPAMTRLMNERETAAFVQENDVIGRKDDKNNIIDMLLNPQYAEERVSVIPIVGFGGLGKTTLAQLVLSDERVKKEFQIAKWACVPDFNNQKEVLGKICKAFTDQSYADLSLDQLKSRITESINNNKYLLVLDDIWDESHSRWLDLKVLLECGGRGSKIIVTTRSSKIANRVCTVGKPYNLGLLEKGKSWELFQRLAFRPGQEETNPNLTKIGQEIVENCGNLPLALRMVGSLLYCKSEDEWEMFRNRQVLKAKLTEDDNVMPVLKLSYDYLEPALKQCFAYCSLFPEDYEFNKIELVRLWMAQGYVQPSNEEEGDQYFMELLRRNFFQDVKEDVERSSMRYKMHDLVHDLAKEVAGCESIVVDDNEVQLNDRILHINVVSGSLLWGVSEPLLAAVKMRSLVLGDKRFSFYHVRKVSPALGLISRFRSLRSLNLGSRMIEKLPNSIEKLRHLRYLNLSDNSITSLPDDITRLENLQSLDLSNCRLLTKLPRGFTKLTCLRHLGVEECNLTEMPSEFKKMKSLRELSDFIVGELNGLDALGGLNLRGQLSIRNNIWRRDMLLEAQGMNLKAKQHLTSLALNLGIPIGETYDDSSIVVPSRIDVEICMKHLLLLPPNLRFLQVNNYHGGKFPVGMVADLHKLVEVQIKGCLSCRSLPLLSHLPLLEILSLYQLDALEYIDDEQSMSGSNPDRKFFPSLEFLHLSCLKELKGWSRVEKKERVCFPRLSKLHIRECPKMMSMPQMPRLVSLDAFDIHEKLLMNSILGWQQEAHDSAIGSLRIRSISGLVSLPLDFCNVHTLGISICMELSELILGYPNSPKKLSINGCERLRNTSQGLQHLSVIEKLEIRNYGNLDVWDVEDNEEDESHSEEKDEDIMDENEEGENCEEDNKIRGWQALTSLRDLELMFIRNLKTLPRGIAYLHTLQRLYVFELPNLTDMSEHIGQLSQLRQILISYCPKLACLPQSIRGLTSLQELKIIECPLLTKRCQRPDGQDWPLIHHIPDVYFN